LGFDHNPNPKHRFDDFHNQNHVVADDSRVYNSGVDWICLRNDIIVNRDVWKPELPLVWH
jgi:hypothetical protein